MDPLSSQSTSTPDYMARVYGAYPMTHPAIPIDVRMRAPVPRLKNSVDSGCSTASQGKYNVYRVVFTRNFTIKIHKVV